MSPAGPARRRGPLAGVVASWLVLAAGPAFGVADASGLCPAAADPCVVDTAIPVDDGALLDVGARTLEVVAGGRLDVGGGSMTVSAGAVRVRAGGRITGSGGSIRVVTSGAIETEPTSRIDVSGPIAGVLSLEATGDATVAGVLDAQAGGPTGGGLVAVRGAAVTVSASARVIVRADSGAGGGVSLQASGPLVVDAPLEATGFEGGGAVECDAQTVLLNERVDVSGGAGGGAVVDIRARGPVVVNGAIDGDARGSQAAGGGLAAEVSIFAQGPVELNGGITLVGGAPGGEGGMIDVVATGDVTQRGAIQTRGLGSEGIGGEFRVATDGGVTLGDIDVAGGFAANRVLIGSKGIVRLTGVLAAEPLGTGFGGIVEMTACAFDMDSIARVSTLGREGRTALTASGHMILRGTLESGGENSLTIRDAATPPLILGTVSPAPTTTVDPTLPPCEGGPGDTTTTTIPAGACESPALAPYDALLCRLSAIRLTIEDATAASLGGRRAARGLERRAGRALRAVEIARSGRRVGKKLRAAGRQLARLLGRLQRGLDRGRIDATIGARLLEIGSRAASEIEALTP